MVGRSGLSTGYPVISYDSWALRQQPLRVRTNEKDARVRGRRNGNETEEELEEKIVIVSPIAVASR